MKKFIVILATLLFCEGVSYAASVTDFKADGTDVESDETAFYNALYLSGDDEVTVPDGTYYIDALTIPKGKTLRAEEGAKPVIIAIGSGNLFTLNENSVLDGLTLKNGGECQNAVYIYGSAGTNILNCVIDDFLGYGIENDHGDGMICDNITVRNVKRGVNTTFSSDITVINSYFKNCSQHGIQFWNNWEGSIDGGNMHFENNTVMDVAAGGIWGTGADGIVMKNNRIDNCGDVGLDLEFCINGVMEDNYVSRCKNAELAIFHGCKNIVMKNNTIYNNWHKPDEKAVLAGIWLTGKSSEEYDTGHDNIEIYNNLIYSIDDGVNGYYYSGIEIPYSSESPKNISIYDNVIVGNNRDIVFQGSHKATYNEMDVDIEESEIKVYDEDVPDFDLIFEENEILSICESGRFVSNNVTGIGRYKYVFNISADDTNTSGLNISVMEGDNVIASKELQPDDISETGTDIEIECDADGKKITGFQLDTTNTANMKVNSIKVYRADVPFYHVLSSKYGIEYMNNSARNLGAKIVLLYPEDDYGVAGRIIFHKNINFKTRDAVFVSGARK